MLPKKNRADKKAIENIFKKGIFIRSSGLNLKYIFKNNIVSPPQISFIVPKTVEKKATKRNSLRRRGYISLLKYFNKIPNGFVGVFIFNKMKGNLTELIDKEIEIIFNKLKFINKNEKKD